jgi:signal transduction histidine kinase
VTLRAGTARVAFWLRHPRTTVRWRLTLLYGGLFLACGAGLLAITYTLVAHATLTSNAQFIKRAQILTGGPTHFAGPGDTAPFPGPGSNVMRTVAVGGARYAFGRRTNVVNGPPQLPPGLKRLLRSKTGQQVAVTLGAQQRISDLHQLVEESSIALAIMALISAGLGWLVAGRVLAPLRTMTATTQQISEASLDRRLALQGPRDELRQLADTIDGLLGRLEGAFNAQRRFVANASHELRTPLTAARALLEMVLTDPHATVKTFRVTCEQVLEESAQQEQLIDALLALAQGQRGVERRETIDLAALTAEVLQAHEREAATRRLAVQASLEPVAISGDRRLLARLLSNLLENAIRHNTAGGHIRVVVTPRAGLAELAIENSGPAIPGEEVQRLLQPFQRLAADRVGHSDGLGLGLSIVAAIADAHQAMLDVNPGSEGGLRIEVRFAAAPARVQRASLPPADHDGGAHPAQGARAG